MRRSLLLLAGILAITYFQFAYYPGHSYLRGESQTLVAAMERLRSPGFLSRDLAALNPNLTYTIYDEVSLFLARVSHHELEWVLGAQQFAFRLAGLLGLWLLAEAAGLKQVSALLVSGLIGFAGCVPLLHVAISNPEPTPFSFAFSLTILAFGLVAQSKPLLAGFFGGLALSYQPTVGCLFWAFVLTASALNRAFRPIGRATLPALVVFGLLLANAAQLQPGTGEGQPLFQAISNGWLHLQLDRTPDLWISTWPASSLISYALAAVTGCLALHRLSAGLSNSSRLVFRYLNVVGVVVVPTLLVSAEVFRRTLFVQLEPQKLFALSLVTTLVLAAAAGLHSLDHKNRGALLWFIPFLVAPAFVSNPLPSSGVTRESQSVQAVSAWAQQNTWGGSMFLFPDAGRSATPGEFRGRAVRAVYVDWNSGELTRSFPLFAAEWRRHWQQTGANTFSAARLQELLNLPIEYVVLHQQNALLGVEPELVTPTLIVYDAHVLERAARP